MLGRGTLSVTTDGACEGVAEIDGAVMAELDASLAGTSAVGVEITWTGSGPGPSLHVALAVAAGAFVPTCTALGAVVSCCKTI